MLTTTLVAAPPALCPLAAKGTTRAPSVALSPHPTVPVIPANLNMRSKAQSEVRASAELRTSATTFTPGEKEHKTPIKTTGAAAADEDEELCAWLRQKASLTQRAVDKALPKLHEEDVYDLDGLHALHSLDSLEDVFSRVVALQVANALDKLTISNQEPAGLTTPRPRAATMAAVPGTAVRGIDFDAAPHSQQPEAAAENDKEPASLPEPTRSGGEGGSLGEEVEQAEPPTTQCNRNWEMPPNPPTASAARTPAPAPAEPSRAEAPATSPPPVDSQPTPPPFKFDANWEVPSSKGPPFKFEVPLTFDSSSQPDWQSRRQADPCTRQSMTATFLRESQEELETLLATEQSIKDFSSWQLGYQQEERRKTRPGPWPDARLPYEWRYGERAWRALELYDRWLRGEVLEAGEEGVYEDASIECTKSGGCARQSSSTTSSRRRCATSCASATLTASWAKWTGRCFPECGWARPRLSTRASQSRASTTGLRLPCTTSSRQARAWTAGSATATLAGSSDESPANRPRHRRGSCG